MKATPEQYTRVMNDMQTRKQAHHNRDNHDERCAETSELNCLDST